MNYSQTSECFDKIKLNDEKDKIFKSRISNMLRFINTNFTSYSNHPTSTDNNSKYLSSDSKAKRSTLNSIQKKNLMLVSLKSKHINSEKLNEVSTLQTSPSNKTGFRQNEFFQTNINVKLNHEKISNLNEVKIKNYNKINKFNIPTSDSFSEFRNSNVINEKVLKNNKNKIKNNFTERNEGGMIKFIENRRTPELDFTKVKNLLEINLKAGKYINHQLEKQDELNGLLKEVKDGKIYDKLLLVDEIIKNNESETYFSTENFEDNVYIHRNRNKGFSKFNFLTNLGDLSSYKFAEILKERIGIDKKVKCRIEVDRQTRNNSKVKHILESSIRVKNRTLTKLRTKNNLE